MSITSGIVLFCVIWALVFYMILPLGQTSQAEGGEVVPGTPASAPVNARLGIKALVTSAIAVVVFTALVSAIAFEWLTLDMLAWIEPPHRG